MLIADKFIANLPIKRSKVRLVISACIMLFVLFIFLPLEYENIKAKAFIYPIMWVIIGFIVFRIFPAKSSGKSISLIILGITGFFYTITHIIGFCAWGQHGTLYINKQDKSIKIVCRTYDCFGTADGCQLFQIRKITKHINWVTGFDEKIVDTTKWKSVSFSASENN